MLCLFERRKRDVKICTCWNQEHLLEPSHSSRCSSDFGICFWSFQRDTTKDRTNTFAVYVPVLHSLNCSIFTYYILCAPAYIPTLHNPTNALHPTCILNHYIPTLHTYTTPTNLQNTEHLPIPYIPAPPLQPLQHNTPYALHCMLALPLHTCSMGMWLGGAVAIC